MKKTIFAIFICLAMLFTNGPVYADNTSVGQEAQGFINRSVTDSVVSFHAPIDAQTKSVKIAVKKGKKQYNYIATPEAGYLDTTVYLPFGPGKYKLDIQKSKTDNGKGYSTLKSVTVDNTDTALNFSDQTVNNSELNLDTYVEKGTKEMSLHIVKGKLEIWNNIAINSERFSQKIALPFGPGKYEIHVIKSSDTTDERYGDIGQNDMIVTNTDTTANIGENTVKDSLARFSCPVEESTKSVTIVAKKGKNRASIEVVPVNNRIDSAMYLPFGPGEYQMEIVKSTDIKDENYGKNGWLKFKAMNSDSSMNFSDRLVNDSFLKLSVPVEKTAVVLTVNIVKGDKRICYDILPINNRLEEDLYFPYGAGEYAISIVKSTDRGVEGYGNIGRVSFKVTNTDTADREWLLPSFYVDSDDPDVIALAKELTKDCKTDKDKTLAIHDWVCQNISYDYEEAEKDIMTPYTGGDTLRRKMGVCNDYAELTAALHRAIGMKARVVNGYSVNKNRGETLETIDKVQNSHAWNEILVDGRWLIEDTTWDAGYMSSEGKKFVFLLNHKYFDISAEELANDHYRDVIANDRK